MPSEFVIDAANYLQGSIPFLSLSAYIPQWRKLIKTKSSNDISFRSWIIWTVSSSIAVFYAVVQYQLTGQGWALIFSCVSNFIFVIMTVYFVLIYRKR